MHSNTLYHQAKKNWVENLGVTNFPKKVYCLIACKNVQPWRGRPDTRGHEKLSHPAGWPLCRRKKAPVHYVEKEEIWVGLHWVPSETQFDGMGAHVTAITCTTAGIFLPGSTLYSAFALRTLRTKD